MLLGDFILWEIRMDFEKLEFVEVINTLLALREVHKKYIGRWKTSGEISMFFTGQKRKPSQHFCSKLINCYGLINWLIN